MGSLDADLAELGLDGEVGVHALVQQGGQRPPIGLVRNELVVVPCVEQDIALRMPDQVKPTGIRIFSSPAVALDKADLAMSK